MMQGSSRQRRLSEQQLLLLLLLGSDGGWCCDLAVLLCQAWPLSWVLQHIHPASTCLRWMYSRGGRRSCCCHGCRKRAQVRTLVQLGQHLCSLLCRLLVRFIGLLQR